MKILYIITKSNWGGAQRYVFDLATHFNTQVDYDIVVALGGNGELKRKLEEKNIRAIQIAALERNIKMTGDIRAFFEILKLLHEEKPGIVHLNSTKAGFLGALASFFYKLTTNDYRLTTIFTAHGWAFNEPRPWWQKLVIGKMQWLTVLLSDRTIVVSEHLKKQTRWWPFVSQKISVIHNGIPELSFLPREEAALYFEKTCGKLGARFGIEETREAWREKADPCVRSFPQEVRIVTIAELHKNKGLDVAIEALSLVRDKNFTPAPFLPLFRQNRNAQSATEGNVLGFTYTIIGEGEERATLEMLIKWYELEERVFLAGHISEAYKYLKAFDVFLLPSRTEALSYALIEAAYAGLPVVATNVGGIPEVVEHKKTGLLVPTENPRALAHALRYMIVNHGTRTHAGHALGSTITNKFSLETMFEKTKDLYQLTS